MLEMGIRNRYDYLLVFSIVICGLGYIAAPLYPARIWALILIPVLVKKYPRYKIPTYLRDFLFIWFIFAILSLLWTYSLPNGIKHFFYLICNISSFLSIYILSLSAKKPIQSLLLGWLLLICIMSPIALYEFSTGQHVIPSYQETDLYFQSSDGISTTRKYAYVTFGALNAYNVVLCYCLIYLITSFFYFKEKIESLFLYILLFLVTYQILMNASRGALLCLGLCVTIFIYKAMKSQIIPRMWLFFMLIFLIILIYLNKDDILNQILGRIMESSLLEDNSRTSIYNLVFTILLDSFGMGVGIGSNEHAMYTTNPYFGITATHNLFLEYLLQFGLIPFLFFIFFLYKLYYSLYINQYICSSVLGLLMIITSIPMFIIDSGYLLTSILWVFWGSGFAIMMISKSKLRFEKDKHS